MTRRNVNNSESLAVQRPRDHRDGRSSNDSCRTGMRRRRNGNWKFALSVAALVATTLVAQQPPGAQTPAPAAPQQPSDVAVVISSDPGTPPKYAVPDFIALSPEATDIAKALGQVLWDDLNYEREFYMIPRDTAATIPQARSAEQVPFAAWREIGADGVVFGT